MNHRGAPLWDDHIGSVRYLADARGSNTERILIPLKDSAGHIAIATPDFLPRTAGAASIERYVR